MKQILSIRHIPFLIPLFYCLVAFPWFAASQAPDTTQPSENTVLTLPIRFHIMSEATMTLKDQKMDMWVNPEDITGPIIQELNRIWKPANIQFSIESATVKPVRQPKNFADICQDIANFKRGDEVTKGNQRIEMIDQLLDPKHHNPRSLNVYLLPYLGGTYQGYATLGGNNAVVGVWSDKYSKGKKPPIKTLLVEPEPMKRGSLTRTIAHEIGHNLTLQHPDKSVITKEGRLMGGSVHGYALSKEEIIAARASAEKHLIQFNKQ